MLYSAYEAELYDQPCAVTAQELAADLGISGATFSQRRRAADRKLVSLVAEARMAG